MGCTYIEVTRSVSADVRGGAASYTNEYRATCNNQFDGPSQIALHFAFPREGVTTWTYGNSFDISAICRRVYGFKRGQSNKGVYYWIFSADFEWLRETDIESQSQTVTPFFVDTVRPVFAGTFIEFVKANRISAGIDNPDFPPFTDMPICNSAQTPIIPAPEVRSSMAGYRVQYYEKTWFDYKQYLNKTNKYPVTLEMLDYTNYGGTNGAVLFSKTFAANTCLLANVQTSVDLIYDRRWFNTTIELLEDDWFHYELDRGITKKVANGDYDGRGGTYSAADFAAGQPKIGRVMGANGQPVNEPVLFNGSGKPLTNPVPSNAIYLKFGMYPEVDFTGLGIF